MTIMGSQCLADCSTIGPDPSRLICQLEEIQALLLCELLPLPRVPGSMTEEPATARKVIIANR